MELLEFNFGPVWSKTHAFPYTKDAAYRTVFSFHPPRPTSLQDLDWSFYFCLLEMRWEADSSGGKDKPINLKSHKLWGNILKSLWKECQTLESDGRFKVQRVFSACWRKSKKWRGWQGQRSRPAHQKSPLSQWPISMTKRIWLLRIGDKECLRGT